MKRSSMRRVRDRLGRVETLTQRPIVFERSGGRCEKCGGLLASSWWECHHRKRRSQGGSWSLSNLLALHPQCHHAGVHDDPKTAYEHGYLVRSSREPGDVPVWLFSKRWVLLNPSGGYDEVGGDA